MLCNVSKGQVFYEIRGDGFPIVILHTMGTDHRSMVAWIEPIFEDYSGYKRIYIDLPAHGHSTITSTFRSTDDMRDNIIECLDHILRGEKFSLIGASYGGYIAQGILHQRKDQVEGICLLAPALHLRNREKPDKVVHTRDKALLDELELDIRQGFETLMIYQDQKHLEAFLDEIQPGRLLADREFLLSNWRENGYFFNDNLFADVDSLEQPALILNGKQDSICSYQEPFQLLKKFTHASFVVLDGAGHMIQIEKRRIVQELVKEWLGRVAKTSLVEKTS